MYWLQRLTEQDWIALGTIGTFLLAIAAFVTLYIQSQQFKKARADENERAFKNSSVQLITEFEKQFEDLATFRRRTAMAALSSGVLNSHRIERYQLFEGIVDEIYDFFDTLGFFVLEGYIKADVVHQYFYYWFELYYEFYIIYDIKVLSEVNEATWEHLPKLANILNAVEVKRLGRKRAFITKEMLHKFFSEEHDVK